jgi:hypothetical protein
MKKFIFHTAVIGDGEPVFVEADVFTIIIPLSEAAIAAAGPSRDPAWILFIFISIEMF